MEWLSVETIAFFILIVLLLNCVISPLLNIFLVRELRYLNKENAILNEAILKVLQERED